MITKDQIVEAAKECGIRVIEMDSWGIVGFNGGKFENLTKFAQHFYKQGLSDAAEKCYELDIESFGVMPVRAMQITRACNQAIQQIADEVGK